MADLSQLRSSVEKTKQSLALAIDEHRIKQDALHKLRIEVEQRHLEVDDGQHHVDRVQADVEQEENRLSRVRDKNGVVLNSFFFSKSYDIFFAHW